MEAKDHIHYAQINLPFPLLLIVNKNECPSEGNNSLIWIFINTGSIIEMANRPFEVNYQSDVL